MVEEGKGDLSKDMSARVTDERVNTATHLAAAILSLMGTVLLIVYASVAGKVWHIVGFSVYGFSLVGLFMASTLHHGVRSSPRVEDVLRAVDYFAIYVLIAGTMTPICLTILRGPLGWSVFGVAWAVGLTGIALRAAIPTFPRWVSVTIYVTMGWLGVFMAMPLFRAVGWDGASWIVYGGILYTVGAVVFYVERPNPLPGRFGFHEIWHIFVMGGALCHFLFMYWFVLPAA